MSVTVRAIRICYGSASFCLRIQSSYYCFGHARYGCSQRCAWPLAWQSHPLVGDPHSCQIARSAPSEINAWTCCGMDSTVGGSRLKVAGCCRRHWRAPRFGSGLSGSWRLFWRTCSWSRSLGWYCCSLVGSCCSESAHRLGSGRSPTAVGRLCSIDSSGWPARAAGSRVADGQRRHGDADPSCCLVHHCGHCCHSV